jgi:hypothetical protein
MLFTLFYLALHIVFGGLPVTPISPITNDSHYSFPRKEDTMSTEKTTIRLDRICMCYDVEDDKPAALLCYGPLKGCLEVLGLEGFSDCCLDEDPTADEVKDFVDRWREEADKLDLPFEGEQEMLDYIAELEEEADDGGE